MIRREKREVYSKSEKKGHLYAGSFLLSKSTDSIIRRFKSLRRFFHENRDFANELRLVQDLNHVLELNWNDHKGYRKDFNNLFFEGELMLSQQISRADNHNLQTSAGLEIDMMTKAGIGGQLIDWVGIGTTAIEPTRGTTELEGEQLRIPVNPEGWLTPSSDLLFTGVIAGTNSPDGVYKAAAGYTGNTAEDVLGWVCVLPANEYITHVNGSTMMIFSHVEEVISLV